MSYMKKLVKKIFAPIAFVGILSLGMLTTLGSGGNGAGGTNVLPLFLAYQNGLAGSWTKIDVTWDDADSAPSSINSYITDPSGVFAVMMVCALRDATVAYLIYATLSSYSAQLLRCDNTSTKNTYRIGGSLTYPGDTFTAKLALGNNFRNNWYSLTNDATGDTNYTADVELDQDEDTNFDIFYRVSAFSSFHYKISRSIDISSSPTIDYAPAGSDVGQTFQPDITAYSGLSDFTGLNLKLDMLNTKVLLNEDDTSPTFEKLPSAIASSNDIYVVYAELQNSISSGTQRAISSKLRNDPDSSLTFNEIPNYLPSFTFGNSTNDMIRIDYDSAYDNGISSMDDMMRRVKLSNSKIEWNIYQMMDRFDTSITIPNEVTSLDGWSSDWNVAQSDTKRITHYATAPGRAASLQDYLVNDKQADSSHDNLDFVQISFRPSF